MAADGSISNSSPSSTRWIRVGVDCCEIPERLLLAHAQGELLFITGAGTSMAAGLPDFRGLALQVISHIDPVLHAALVSVPPGACNKWDIVGTSLDPTQLAEAKRFIQGDYDVTLGFLERRVDRRASTAKVRGAVENAIKTGATKPTSIHRALIRLADRGGASSIITTNFDLLLQAAARQLGKSLPTYSLASIPRPSRTAEFAGILHIHGSLPGPGQSGYCVVSDEDFGEFYLRRQIVPDLIYDASRLFNLVLVGYSASDPPMRYLLNSVAADGVRFPDLRDRYVFVGCDGGDEEIVLSDWKSRGIIPIRYDSSNGHLQLQRTLEAWAALSAINGSEKTLFATIRKLTKAKRSSTPEWMRDLLDHLFRRGNDAERTRLVSVLQKAKVSLDWLDAINVISREPRVASR